MKMYLTTILLLIAVSIAHAEVIVDITKIALKSESDVSAYLGKPLSCGKSKYGKKCSYQKGETEVIFINGKADWITVEGIDLISFSTAALTAIGLKDAPPSFSNTSMIRWDSLQGTREVSIFKGVSMSDYAYIKVKTK